MSTQRPLESPHSILVIEDDIESGVIFRAILKMNGYAVRIATDAESALAEMKEALPAAVVLDLHLPTIDGLELLRRVRDTVPLANLPIAVITADYLVDESTLRDLEGLGTRVYLKPLWEEDLIGLVRELLI